MADEPLSARRKRSDPQPGELIAGRYRVESELGRGGMAAAYAVRDLADDRRLALKRLFDGEYDGRQELVQGFEREYHALKELSHPRVVEVYEFGHDGGTAFYTMEWLGGGDLNTLAPLPVSRVCALLADVCSVLSLLHSRGLVHRDVTPRNIRCTDDGLAKLIDFGGVTAFGSVAHVIGTPAFCSPEALHGQELDGRTDLYSLGATAYYALTRSHAYPARTFSKLRPLWRDPVTLPSRVVEGISPELETLILALLSLDRDARPRTAAEVMERLCTIGGVEMREDLVARQAYLTTPRLKGREQNLAELRHALGRDRRKRPRTLSLVAEPGMGRSRFLTACALGAQVQGAIVARADASDATTTFGVARALVGQVLQAIPSLLEGLDIEQRALVSPTSPETSEAESGDELDYRARVQTTLREVVLRACAERPLMLAVDDAHLIDERSAALLSLLSSEQGASGLILVITLPAGTDEKTVQPSLRLFVERATVIKLRPLTAEQTQALLASIFGEVEHLDALADRLHRIAAGSPRALMQLAQHLLDRGAIRYESGSFILPAALDPADLPETVHGMLEARFASLSSTARQLARGLSLVEHEGLTLDELKLLLESDDSGAVMKAVNELFGRNILLVKGLQHLLASEVYRELFTSRLSEEEIRALHLRLAEIYRRRSARGWSVIQHLIAAGEYQTALELMLPGARDHSNLNPAEVAATVSELPEGWQDHLRALIDYCDRVGRPRDEAHFVRSTLVGYGALAAQATKQDVMLLLKQLEHDCGVDLYRALPDDMDPTERAMTALRQAQERFDRMPPHERVTAPGQALPLLAREVIGAIGVIGAHFDYPFFRDLTSIEPFVSLSPALQVVQWNIEGTRSLATGHYHILLERNRAIMERMAQPDRAGLDPAAHHFMGLALRFSNTIVTTVFGRQLNEEFLADLESDPIFTVNACRLRMLDALCRGDISRADELKRKAELIRLRDNRPQMFEGSHVFREYVVYAFAGDLARLKQLLPVIEARAEYMHGWKSILRHARGCYHSLRGAPREALADFRAGLEGLRAGEHPTYAWLAAGEVLALCKLGEQETAVEKGEAHLAAVREVELGPQMHVVIEAVARAHAENGGHDRARLLADEAIAMLEDFGAGGLVMGGAYETRARVALLAGDQRGFDTFAARCAALYQDGHNPLLIARNAELTKQAAAARLQIADNLAEAAQNRVASSLHTLLFSDFADREERSRVALKAVLREADAESGFLYTVQADGAQLTAQVGAIEPPPDLDALVEGLLEQLSDDQAGLTATCTIAVDEGDEQAGHLEWSNASGAIFIPLVLCHLTDSGRLVTGIVVLGPGARAASIPQELLFGISQALQRAGDVNTLVANW